MIKRNPIPDMFSSSTVHRNVAPKCSDEISGNPFSLANSVLETPATGFKDPVTEVHGRTIGVWTLLTCTLCFLCAFNLENKPLYLVTLLSFIYAFGHFLTEYLFYLTMALSNLTTVGIFAGTSIKWMLLQSNALQRKT